MKLNRHNSLLKSGRVKDSMLEHRAIVEALVRRDAKAAVRKMQEHFRNGLEAAA
jgi:DNA-binding GntR family transcriptional regulator